MTFTRNRRTRPLDERFWERAERRGPGECWPWKSAHGRQVYGTIGLGRRSEGNVMAHRYAYESMVGPIPDGLVIDHLCRNRFCVNPEHMEPVTSGENLRRAPVNQARINATHCPQGHSYNEANTRIKRNGTRCCRVCRSVAA